MNKINIKNPLTIFTSSLKQEGVNLIVEAEEVEVIEEEEKMYFYVEDAVNRRFTFVLPQDNITLATLLSNYGVVDRDYYFYYSTDTTSYICSSKIQIDASITSTIWINDAQSLVKETTDYVSNGEVINAYLGGSN